jgi:hypothetical protein
MPPGEKDRVIGAMTMRLGIFRDLTWKGLEQGVDGSWAGSRMWVLEPD